MNRSDQSPATRGSLVLRLRDSHDHVAWGQFVDVYAPLIHAYCLHHGMQDADAADLAQDVLQSVATNAGRFDYDPRKGSFRGWLFTIARNKLRNELAKRKGRAQAEGGTEVQERMANVADESKDEDVWNREHQRRLFQWAAERVQSEFQPATWEAFWKTTVDETPAAEAARLLNLSVGAVYIAKSRVLARLREVIGTIENDE